MTRIVGRLRTHTVAYDNMLKKAYHTKTVRDLHATKGWRNIWKQTGIEQLDTRRHYFNITEQLERKYEAATSGRKPNQYGIVPLQLRP